MQYYRRPDDIVDFDLNDLAGNYYKLRNDYNLLTDRHLKVRATWRSFDAILRSSYTEC